MNMIARLAPWLVVVGAITADFARFTIYRAFTAGDLLLMTGFAAAVVGTYPLGRVPLWYWMLALSFGAGTIVAQLAAPSGALGPWGLHWYFYVFVVPLTWSVLRHNGRFMPRAVACVFVVQAVAALEVVVRVVRHRLAWWEGPAVPLIGSLTNTAAFAIALLFGIALLMREWVHSRRLVALLTFSAGVFVLAGGVLVGNKRAVWAAAALGLMAMLAFTQRRLVGAIAVAGGTVALGSVLVLQMPAPVRDRVVVAAQAALNPGEGIDSSYSARVLAQRRVLNAFFDGPWSNVFFGFGYRQSTQYVGTDLATSSTGGAHNTFVNYLVETGLAGVSPLLLLWSAVAFAAAGVWVGARRRFHRQTADGDRGDAALAAGLAAAVAVLLVELLFAPDLYLRLGFLVAGAVLATWVRRPE